MHIKYFALYYYLFTRLLIASDVFMYVINSKNNSDVIIYTALIMKYAIENHIRYRYKKVFEELSMLATNT